MTPAEPRRSTLAMVLLALLTEAPMHPYRMQQMIKERGQDQLVNVAQRNSVYQALDRLVRDGLARRRRHRRARPGGPERTVYEITEEGAAALRRWLTEHAAGAGPRVPGVPGRAGVPADPGPRRGRTTCWTQRVAALRENAWRASRPQAPPGLPRLFLIEDEYRAAMLRAELQWLGRVVADLADGAPHLGRGR